VGQVFYCGESILLSHIREKVPVWHSSKISAKACPGIEVVMEYSCSVCATTDGSSALSRRGSDVDNFGEAWLTKNTRNCALLFVWKELVKKWYPSNGLSG